MDADIDVILKGSWYRLVDFPELDEKADAIRISQVCTEPPFSLT